LKKKKELSGFADWHTTIWYETTYRLVWAQDLTPRASGGDARGITFFIQKLSSKKYDIPIPL
jgi:hypothetical protein